MDLERARLRRFAAVVTGRLALVAGTALLVMGVGSLILGPTPQSDGLGDYLLPSEPPAALAEEDVPIVDVFSSFPLSSPPVASNIPLASPISAASPTAVPSPAPLAHKVTRIVLTKASVDLPVLEPKDNETFPYCDVAERLAYYDVPGNGNLTYLYAHARPKMFGGLLVASWKPNSYLLGALVQVYTSDNLVYTYKVTEIHRRQSYTSFKVADNLKGESLIMQASETASKTGTKLVVVARPVKVGGASQSAAHPDANPRTCG